MFDKSTNHGNEVMVVQFFSFSHAQFSKKLKIDVKTCCVIVNNKFINTGCSLGIGDQIIIILHLL